MANARKLLARMTENPRGDWRIEDVQSVCSAFGVACRSPRAGSHYVISHPSQREILTVPFRRPIKPVYVRALAAYIAAVRASTGDG